MEYIIRNFASELSEIPVMRKKKKDVSVKDYDALRAEITRLKKALRYEKMRFEALDTMIDVTEEMFNVPVIKNWYQTVRRLHAHRSEAFTVSELCGLFDKSKLITNTTATLICVACLWKSSPYSSYGKSRPWLPA